MEALKQQWSAHELLVYDGDRKRDRDRNMRAYVEGGTDEWEPEMHLNETATESAWNANESRDEAGSWEVEDNQFEGSFADEDEEEAFNLAGTQLNEALASKRNARRTVAQTRAIMHELSRVVVVAIICVVCGLCRGVSCVKVQTRKVQGQEMWAWGISKGQGKNRNSRGRAPCHRFLQSFAISDKGVPLQLS